MRKKNITARDGGVTPMLPPYPREATLLWKDDIGVVDDSIVDILITKTSFAEKDLENINAIFCSPLITEITNNAFINFSGLPDFYMPVVDRIGAGAFREISSSGRFFAPRARFIEDRAFYQGNQGGGPSYLFIHAAEQIGESAFEGLGLSHLLLPKVTDIGANAFKDTTVQQYLALPSIKSIGANAFSGTSIKIIDFSQTSKAPDIDATSFGTSTTPSITILVPGNFNNWIAGKAGWSGASGRFNYLEIDPTKWTMLYGSWATPQLCSITSPSIFNAAFLCELTTNYQSQLDSLITIWGGSNCTSIDIYDYGSGVITTPYACYFPNVQELAWTAKLDALQILHVPSAVTVARLPFADPNLSIQELSFPSATHLDAGYTGIHGLVSLSATSVTTLDFAIEFSGNPCFTELDVPNVEELSGAFGSNQPDTRYSLTYLSLPKVKSISGHPFYHTGGMLREIDFSQYEGVTPPTISSTDVFSYSNTGIYDTPSWQPMNCNFVVPNDLYDDWVTAANWSTLYDGGQGDFTFVQDKDYSNLLYVRANAFKDCSNITSLVLPTTVTPVTICFGNNAFAGCPNIEDIDLRNVGGVADAEGDPFPDIPFVDDKKNALLLVPSSLKTEYEDHLYWGQFDITTSD